ncbi:hypothetical protein SAMN05444172_6977 [Burkholderia sp. GAS332]|nr:hypothetical protein SAMN05444172_6977 [Burkholderia sp. GAS332]
MVSTKFLVGANLNKSEGANEAVLPVGKRPSFLALRFCYDGMHWPFNGLGA